MRPFYAASEREQLARQPGDPLALAWALRQLEPERSVQLFAALPGPLARAWEQLAQADSAACAEDFEPAQALLQSAGEAFERLELPHAHAMCGWVQVQLAWARGEEGAVEALLEGLIGRFVQLGEPEQADLARLELAARCATRDLARCRNLCALVRAERSAAVAALLAMVQALVAVHSGDSLRAAQGLLRAFEAALDYGMRYRAVALCALLAHSFSGLGDLGGAAEWAQRGLDLAAPGWTLRSAACRYELGAALLRQQQTDAARQVFENLIKDLQLRPLSRAMQQTRWSLGRLEAAQGRWGAAQAQFEALLEGAQRARFIDTQAEALEGLSACALAAGQQARARELLQQGLQLARAGGYGKQEQDLLLQGARIELEAGAPAAALALLEPLRARLQRIPGAEAPVELLRGLAQAYEQLDQLAAALQCERLAAERERTELTSACEQRLQVLQTQQELQHTRQENEALRRMGEAAAQRAAAAEHNLHTLEQLAQIGRGLTARLQPAALFPLLERELRGLLPVNVMMLFQRRGEQLELLYGHEDGHDLALAPIALDDPHALSARCAREDQLLCLDGEQLASRIPGVPATHSLLFAPLRWQDHVVGVLSLQAQARSAYGPPEQQLVLNLAAYLAIALENCRAYEQVSALQHELAERRRQAALGSLVAGVAHELNTPLGNCLLVLSAMQAQLQALLAQVDSPAPKRSLLQSGCADLAHGMDLVERALQRAALLVEDFKGLASQPESEPPEALDPSELCQELLRSQQGQLKQAGLVVETRLQPAPGLLSRRHALLEVLRALLDNVLVHAAAARLEVRGAIEGGHYRIDWIDNGRGIAVEPPERVFDPFYSTRFGQGGSGLGLSVALHRARVLLGGELQVQSQPGQGCHFLLSLPLAGPDGDQLS
ncbi:ATP-binding protein [Inhella sp.]|uniref:ATP-binding protein n=1 Tax=Inhella sp. TaxID=1921806 RepID=UPI0035B43BA3